MTLTTTFSKVFAAAFVLLMAGCELSSVGLPDLTGGTHTVTYKVTGDGSLGSVDVKVQEAGDKASAAWHNNVSLPFERSYTYLFTEEDQGFWGGNPVYGRAVTSVPGSPGSYSEGTLTLEVLIDGRHVTSVVQSNRAPSDDEIDVSADLYL